MKWIVILYFAFGTMEFETTQDACLAAERLPVRVEMADGTMAVPERTICQPCLCIEAETDEGTPS